MFGGFYNSVLFMSAQALGIWGSSAGIPVVLNVVGVDIKSGGITTSAHNVATNLTRKFRPNVRGVIDACLLQAGSKESSSKLQQTWIGGPVPCPLSECKFLHRSCYSSLMILSLDRVNLNPVLEGS